MAGRPWRWFERYTDFHISRSSAPSSPACMPTAAACICALPKVDRSNAIATPTNGHNRDMGLGPLHLLFILSRSGRAAERYRFLTMPSSPKLSGVPKYGLAVFLDVLIEPNAGGRWPVSIKTDRKGERADNAKMFVDVGAGVGKTKL